MPSANLDADAVVVGAGTAGSAAACKLAQRGLRVVLVEARAADAAGARWVNDVPAWMFAAADLPPPHPPEDRGRARAFVLTDAEASVRQTVRPSPVTGVDVRLLVKRLQVNARHVGVQILDHACAGSLQLAGGRPERLEVERRPPDGPAEAVTLRARLFVDASGMAAVLRRQVPGLEESRPAPRDEDVCTAAQEVCEVHDRAGAERFLERHRLQPGEIFARLGVDGGYSTLRILIDEDLERVELLAGAIHDGLHTTGARMLTNIRLEEPWIGRARFGGSGLIPLTRPRERLVAPGIALIGDAAGQVFPAHGSGTGMGLIAARLLGDAMGGSDDPGDEHTLWRYQTRFQRRYGGPCAAYDVFRRLSQRLSPPEIKVLIETGALSANGFRAGLDQRLPRPDLHDLLAVLRLVPRFRILSALATGGARMAGILALYRRFPARPDPVRLRRWSIAVGMAAGDRRS